MRLLDAAGLDLRAKAHLATSLQVGGFQVARYLASDPAVFWSAVREIESDPLFRKLWRGQGQRAIRIVPRRGCFARVADTAGGQALEDEVESMLEDFGPLVARLRALGRSAFSALFLESGHLTLAEAAEAAGASLEEMERFQRAVVDRVAILDAVHGPVALKADAYCATPRNTLEPIGQVEARQGHLHFNMFFDRVRYQVDDAVVQAMQRQGALDPKEAARWSDLRRKLNWINLRFSLVNRVVEAAAGLQAPYLLSCREEDRSVLEMKQVASSLGVHPSWVCRIIAGKSLLAPCGEVPLRMLFLQRRRGAKAHGIRRLQILLDEYGDHATDRELQAGLAAHGITVARRTVNVWRRTLSQAEGVP